MRSKPVAFPLAERLQASERARDFCRAFVAHYNHHHRFSGIGLMTPAAAPTC